MLSMSKAILLEVDTVQAFPHLNDLQILHLLVFFRPSEYVVPSVALVRGDLTFSPPTSLQPGTGASARKGEAEAARADTKELTRPIPPN